MAAATDSYDFIVVGCGAAGLSAAIGYITAARQQGRTPRVAVLETSAGVASFIPATKSWPSKTSKTHPSEARTSTNH